MTYSSARRLFPAPGIPITRTTSPSRCGVGCSRRIDCLPKARSRTSRSAASRTSVAARAAERGVGTPGARDRYDGGRELQQPRERDLSRGCVKRFRDACERLVTSNAAGTMRRGEWAITAIPVSAQRSMTPPRSARSSKGLNATWTAVIGASSSASSSWERLTFERPTCLTTPSSTSRASARTEVRHGVRGSGAWMR